MARKTHRIPGLAAVMILSIASFARDRDIQFPAEKGFGVFGSGFEEWSPAVAYNFKDDEFLVVAVVRDTLHGGNDIYGQFVKPDGGLRGNRFPICLHPSDQYSPDAAYGKNNEFLVVWYDTRMGNSDIFGARLDASGRKLKNPITYADTTFVICNQDSSQNSPRVAHNPADNNYLVVWTDYRNSLYRKIGKRIGKAAGPGMVNSDVYGQRLDEQGVPIAPEDPPSTKVNFPIAVDNGYDEYYQDVAFCGGGDRPDEWLVVFTKYNVDYTVQEAGRIWGVRIDGKTGDWLDTEGKPMTPGLSKSSGTLGGLPWAPHFPISSPDVVQPDASSIYRGSPHVESNTGWLLHTGLAQALHSYPLAECLTAWTEYAYPDASKIRAQRVAYFPDSTAFRRGFKQTRGKDGTFTLLPLDSSGHPAVPADAWITWQNMKVTDGAVQHEDNNIAYNPVSGDFFVAWNDWRASGWNGSYPGGGPYIPPQADLYGQRLYLSPWDSSIVFLDQGAQKMADPYNNIPIVNTSADEGNQYYPGIAYGYSGDRYLLAYEWEQDTDNMGIDVQAAFFTGLPTAVRERAAGPAPREFLLARNFPNPFNPETTIEIRTASAGRVRVQICDAMGRDVATLLDETRQPGRITVRWDGSDALGNAAGSGVYFYRVQSGPHTVSRKMLLLR